MAPPKLLSRIAVINNRGQLLLVRRSKTAPRRAFDWELPGGIIEPGEDPKAAAIRELHEEAGVKVTDANYLFAGTVNDLSFTGFFYYARVDNPQVKLSFEHDLYKWVEPTEAEKIVTVYGYKLALQVYNRHIVQGLAVSVSTKCLVTRADKILLLKRAEDDKLGPGAWDLPGGGLEQGEGVYDSMQREINEEIKLNVNNLQLVFGHTELSEKVGIKIRIGLLAQTEEITPVLSHEHSDFTWVEKSKAYNFANHPNWPGWGEFVKIFG